MTFLDVFECKINRIKVRIYRNSEASLLLDVHEAQKYVNELIMNNFELSEAKKIVVILWENERQRMADLWVFGEQESEQAGASVCVYLFRELERYESPEVTAADGLIVLGAEASEFARK